MDCYIALLRGINVGGHKKILMADLKSIFVSLGFEKVITYIQSGNVVFNASEKELDLSNKISEAIDAKYSFNVPVLVKKASELNQIVSKCPFSDEKREKSYFILLKENPSKENMDITAAFSSTKEEFSITKNCIYIYYATGAGKAKMGINFFEKKLEVDATARNYRSMTKLITLAGL